ncbi:MAG: hypothetical protein U1A78_27800 [Polyangia bacterium]
MNFTISVLSLGAVFAMSPGSCGGTDPTPPAADMTAAKAQWYKTCGDPVCRGYTPPTGVALCTSEKLGDPCATVGQQCDPKDGCNALYRCATADPTMQPGGCPISRQKYKTDIAYLDDTARQRFADELHKIRLATYRYKAGGPTRLGFLIEDHEPSVSIDAERDMVDLYSYTSLAVAALQVQEQQIRALREELAELRKQLQKGSKARAR